MNSLACVVIFVGCLSPCAPESQGCHLIPLSYLLSCFSASSSCSFYLVIVLLIVLKLLLLPAIFPESVSWRVGLSFVWLMWSSWETIVGMCSLRHWYLPLRIYITDWFLFCFCPLFLFLLFFNNVFFNLVSINQTKWLTIPSYASLMCSFNRGNVKGANSSKNCVSCMSCFFFFF